MVPMDITPFVESLRADLVAAAGAAGPEGQAAAERLAVSLEPAARLAIMGALSQAAAEITTALPAGSVEVRLRGRDPEFVVDVPASPTVPEDPPPAEDDGDDAVARITLRIPESLKARVEELAGRSGRSLNSWIVGALRATTAREHVIDVDLTGRSRGRRMTGWV